MARAAAAPRASFREVASIPAVRIATVTTFVIMLGYGLIVPVLPLFARSFGVGRAEVGILVTSFALMRLVFDLVAGPLVDRFGERATATTGAAIVGVSSALAAVAPNFILLVVFRALGGAGSSILFAAMMNFLIHTVRSDQMARTMSLFYASFLLGTTLGQPVGGLIAELLGLSSPLWFYAGACLLSAEIIRRRFSDRPGRAPRSREEIPAEAIPEAAVPLPAALGRIKELLGSRAFVVALAANAVMFWSLGSVRMTLVPLFANEEVGLSESGIGVVLGVAAMAQFAVMWKAGAIADSRGRRVVLLPGLLALAGAVAALGWATSFGALAAALAVVGLATALLGVAPAAIVADVAPKRMSGTAVGVYRFAGDVGFVLGPVVAGVVAETAGFTPAFLVLAVPLAAVFVLALAMPETLRREQARAPA